MKIFTATVIISSYMIVGPLLGAAIVALLANWLLPNSFLAVDFGNIYSWRQHEGYLMFAYMIGIWPAVAAGYYIASRATEDKPFRFANAYLIVAALSVVNPAFTIPYLAIVAPFSLVAAVVAFTILQYPTRKVLSLTKYKIVSQPIPQGT